MEASEAGLATDPGTDTTEGAEGQEPQGPDLSPILDRFGELENSFGERFQQIESRLGEPADDSVVYDDGYGNPVDANGNPVTLDEYGQPVDDGLDLDADADPAEVQRQLIERAKTEARNEAMQQIAPVLQKFSDMEMDKLEQEFPELGGDAAESVVAAVQESAQKFGNPALMQDANFVRMVYLAQKGEESAAQETPAGAEGEVALESGGASGLAADRGDEIDQIFAGTEENDFWR